MDHQNTMIDEVGSESRHFFLPMLHVFQAAFKSGAQAVGFRRSEQTPRQKPRSASLCRESICGSGATPPPRPRYSSVLPSSPRPTTSQDKKQYRQTSQAELIRSRSFVLLAVCDKMTVTNMDVLFERKNLMESLEVITESLQEFGSSGQFADAVKALPNDNPVSKSLSEILHLSASLMLRATRLQEHDTAQQRLHEKLVEGVRDVREAVDDFSLSAQLPVLRNDQPRSVSKSSASQRSSASTPSLVAQYMDRKGDLALLQERLYNLEVDHIESQQRYEIRRERGDDQIPLDGKFELDYPSERSRLVQAMAKAERDMDELEAQCGLQGIDFTLASRPSLGSLPENLSLREDWYVLNNVNLKIENSVHNWMDDVPLQKDSGRLDSISDANLGDLSLPQGVEMGQSANMQAQSIDVGSDVHAQGGVSASSSPHNSVVTVQEELRSNSATSAAHDSVYFQNGCDY